ncbi:MAG: glycoside hydrolase family 32 protein [Clostridia bacterium]|nr:glycoside hydrolase family 32 protein [Clostridia bacterium]
MFTSPDLVHWEGQGSALLPDCNEDQNGIYSGSAVVSGGRLYLFYTGNSKEGGVRTSRQCVAVSEDGRRFIKQPVFVETPPGFTQHHRDPKVFRGEKNWWMLVGAQKEDLTGAIALYESDDLLHWKYKSILYDDCLDQVSECPDLMTFDGTDVLVTSWLSVRRRGRSQQMAKTRPWKAMPAISRENLMR